MSVSPSQAAQELLKRRKARKNLIDYIEYTMPRFETSAHHRIITRELEQVEQAVRDGQGARLMIFTPPRHSKSEIASKRFPSWILGRNPHWQIITTTYNAEFAADFGREVRNIVNSDIYRQLFPDVSLRPDSKAAARWNTTNGGVYIAAGAGGALTGRGGHLILIDDPYKDWQEAYSEAIRKARWNWYLTVVRTRLMPGSAIVLIMTRWHDEDLAGKLILEMQEGRGDEWKIVSLPALAEKDDPMGRGLDQPLWPEWFDKKTLMQTKSVMPTYEWSALYQQKPVPDEGDYFKRSYFKFYQNVPKFKNIYITHDDAVTEGGGDFTEIGVWGIDFANNILAIDWWSGQETIDIWMDKLIDFVATYNPYKVFGESGIIRRSVEPFLEKQKEVRKVYFVHEWMPSLSDKAARAASFRGLCSMGRVFFPIGKDWATDVINQLLRFPVGVYDDKVDTCSLIGRAVSKTFKATVPVVENKSKILVADPIKIDDLMRETIPGDKIERL